jgi:starch synthase (maltosyl-transferring)
MNDDGRKRVVVEGVTPEIDCGTCAVKRVTGESVVVEADIFSDGHDELSAVLLFKGPGDEAWSEAPMYLVQNDRWEGNFTVGAAGMYHYTVEGWVDRFGTWRKDLLKKTEAGQDVRADLLVGAALVREASARADGDENLKLLGHAERLDSGDVDAILDEELSMLMQRCQVRYFATRYGKELPVMTDRPAALYSSWYEFFPRSCMSGGRSTHGTLRRCEEFLPLIAGMGFDVVYLPPIHPIGKTNRKGRNNSVHAGPGDAGSPWAIGGEAGGHKSIHPDLGTMDDFLHFLSRSRELGLEVALDLAFQCSPDHPYIGDHPEWFSWRPDGSIRHAENPPKKYEDIVPLNFESENWQGLWEELKSVVMFWVEKGVRIFRVDNPHTKPFGFWRWLIKEVKEEYPDVFFLSEAFTRPKVMYRLAKDGFSQSYTYFTWRTSKYEIISYLNELTKTEVKEYFRPNFWPNTPDILPEHLQYGGRTAFMMRLVLAATLSAAYGIYGPPFELAVTAALPGREEYLDSEKYEVRIWETGQPGNLKDFISRVNRIRRDNAALQSTFNLFFCDTGNENLLCYAKSTSDFSNIIVVVVNLDIYHTHAGFVELPPEFGIGTGHSFLAHDLLGDDKFIWHGGRNYIEVDPGVRPAYIFRIRTRIRREYDFDYFM